MPRSPVISKVMRIEEAETSTATRNINKHQQQTAPATVAYPRQQLDPVLQWPVNQPAPHHFTHGNHPRRIQPSQIDPALHALHIQRHIVWLEVARCPCEPGNGLDDGIGVETGEPWRRAFCWALNCCYLSVVVACQCRRVFRVVMCQRRRVLPSPRIV